MKQDLISSIRFRVKSLPLGSNESEAIRSAILEDVEALESEIIHPCPEGEGVPIDIKAELSKAEPSLDNDITQAIPPLPPVEEAPDNTGSPEGERAVFKLKKRK